MQKPLLVGLVLFLALVVRFSSYAVILPPPPVKKITLTWDYPEENPDIVFNVYGTTNLSLPMTEWPLLATVAEKSCSVPIQGECSFFVVAASNIVSGMESSFSPVEDPIDEPIE